MSYVDSNDSELLYLRGWLLVLVAVIGNGAVMAVRRRHLAALWWHLSGDFWCFEGEMQRAPAVGATVNGRLLWILIMRRWGVWVDRERWVGRFG